MDGRQTTRKTRRYNHRFTKTEACRYSDSCFTCPLADCKVGAVLATKVNHIDIGDSTIGGTNK